MLDYVNKKRAIVVNKHIVAKQVGKHIWQNF